MIINESVKRGGLVKTSQTSQMLVMTMNLMAYMRTYEMYIICEAVNTDADVIFAPLMLSQCKPDVFSWEF